MYANYDINIKKINDIMDKLVIKSNNQYELKDINKTDLDHLLQDVKLIVKQFYFKSILDFQKLLDMAKASPSIHITHNS